MLHHFQCPIALTDDDNSNDGSTLRPSSECIYDSHCVGLLYRNLYLVSHDMMHHTLFLSFNSKDNILVAGNWKGKAVTISIPGYFGLKTIVSKAMSYFGQSS